MSKIFKPIANFFVNRIVPWLGYLIVLFVGKSIPFRIVNGDFVESSRVKGKNVIFAFWHNRLILMPYFYTLVMPGRKNLTVMVSRSRDGQIITGITEKFGYRMVRGSSSRGGQAAMKEMIKLLKSGWDAGYTPDGPRGPRYCVQPGIITLAHLTGYPIIPATYEVTKKKVIQKSWDRMIIPMPFCKGVLMFGSPIEVSKDANENVRAEKAIELKNELMRLMDAGSKELGIPSQNGG